MNDHILLLPLALAGLIAGAQMGRHATMARAHRDVSGFMVFGLLTVACFLLAISFAAVPGAWIWLYDHTIGTAVGR
jgi:hypothetical protein